MHRTAPKLLAAAVLAGSLGLPATASAHVTVQPAEATPGDFTVMNVRVPNEKDDQGTTKVVLRLPDGFNFVSYERVPGWDVEIDREKLPEPVEIEPGFSAEEQITQVTFTGRGSQGVIEPGQFQDFPLSVRVPDGRAGSKLTFKALQSYEEGKVVRWIGAPDADEPAPQVTLVAEKAAAAPAAAPADEGNGNGDGLAVAALIVGGLGLAAGLAGLASARRGRGSAPAAGSGVGAAA